MVSSTQPGPMGWWEHDTDSPFKTLARDRAFVSNLEDRNPALFTPGAEPKVDEHLLAMFKKRQEDKGIVDGKDLTVVEDVVGLDLDEIDPQIIGSCVATSHIVLLALRSLTEVVILGSDETLLGQEYDGVNSIAPFGPFSYRGGRKIGGLNGMGDGSFCGPQIEATSRWGYLACDTPGLDGETDFLPEPKSTSTYRRWGASDQYLNKWKDKAAPTVITTSVQCRTADEAREQIVNHWAPLQICSSWGFSATSKRLPNGDTLWTRRGSWAHSMQVVGIFKLSDGNWYVKIRNQWGRYHSGKVYFLVTLEEFDRWIRQSVTISIAELRQREFDDALEL